MQDWYPFFTSTPQKTQDMSDSSYKDNHTVILSGHNTQQCCTPIDKSDFLEASHGKRRGMVMFTRLYIACITKKVLLYVETQTCRQDRKESQIPPYFYRRPKHIISLQRTTETNRVSYLSPYPPLTSLVPIPVLVLSVLCLDLILARSLSSPILSSLGSLVLIILGIVSGDGTARRIRLLAPGRSPTHHRLGAVRREMLVKHAAVPVPVAADVLVTMHQPKPQRS